MTTTAHRQGKLAEDFVARRLTSQGLKVLQRNFTCRQGEIDLIALSKRELIFVEVRYRSSIVYGGAAASVDFRKQQKIIRTACNFLAQHSEYACYDCRFDVCSVTPAAQGKMALEHIRAAFDAGAVQLS